MTALKLEEWFNSESEKIAVQAYIDRQVYCLGNEFQELYAAKNECWFEDMANFYNPEDDEEIQEVYQWFIVSEWLAKKLIEIGQPVLEANNNYLWGRTCYGQAIELDGTLQQVYRLTQKD